MLLQDVSGLFARGNKYLISTSNIHCFQRINIEIFVTMEA